MRMIGKTITGYKILRRIGKGGMGSVYLGEHTTLNKQAAIKVIDKKFSSDPEIKNRFKREAVLHSKLGHNNIIELFNYIHQDGYHYILMEYFESVELATVIGKQTGPMPHERAVPIFKQILEGIGHGHSRGIIHRDIKPANILINKQDEIKIADFGIAIDSKGDGRLTQIGHSVGTPIYMSPEQILAQEITEASDIYSLGITLYEMLSGRSPFDVGQTEIRTAQVNTMPDPPTKHYPHIPENIVNAVMMALNKKPKDRQQSCDEFLANLEGKSRAVPLSVRKPASSKSTNSNKKKKTQQQPPDPSGVNSVLKWAGGFTVLILGMLLLTEYDKNPASSEKPRSSKPVNIQKAYNKGLNYYEKKKYYMAIDQFAICLKNEPNHYESRHYRARSYYFVEDFKSALFDLNKIIAQRNETNDHKLRAYAYYDLKEYNNAISDFNYVISFVNDDPKLFTDRGWSNYLVAKYKKSKEDFTQSVDLFKKTNDLSEALADAYNGRGLARVMLKDLKGAKSDLTNAIKYNKEYHQYWFNRGLINSDLNKKRKACKDLKKAKSLGSFKAESVLKELGC